MHLSEVLTAGLLECFELNVRWPSEQKLRYRVAGTWYCPGCGIPMQVDENDVWCRRCRKHLNEFIFQLVELHPHRDW